MAGRPILAAQIQTLRDGGLDGEISILDRYASGLETSVQIVKSLGVGNRSFYTWLQEDPERWARWQEAKKLRAEVLAEQSLEIVDNTIPDKDHVAKSVAQLKVRQWLAACADPDVYGKRADATISIGAIHLTAVEAINAEDTTRRLQVARDREAEQKRHASLAAIEGEDYEVIATSPVEDLEALL